MEPLRAKIVRVPMEWLIDVLCIKQGCVPMYYRTITNIPADARLRSVEHNQRTRTFECVFESDSFEPVAEGTMIPYLTLEFADKRLHVHTPDIECPQCKIEKEMQEYALNNPRKEE
jgi:hypothetical protein